MHYKLCNILNKHLMIKKLKIFPVGKIAEKAMWQSVFLCIWHCIFNADSTKTPSPVLLFSDFAGWVKFYNKNFLEL